jgi:hypothetical protein
MEKSTMMDGLSIPMDFLGLAIRYVAEMGCIWLQTAIAD